MSNRKKKSGSVGGEGELDDTIAKMIASTAGQEEEEVTDAEALAVVAEILKGKMGVGGGGGTGAAEDEPQRKTLMGSTTKALDHAGKMIRVAVAHDSNGKSAEALESYEKAIELFSQGLDDEALAEKNASHIVQSLESYLDRSIDLQLGNSTKDFTRSNIFSRKVVLERMVKHDFNALKRGVALYSRAKKDGKDDDWTVSVLYSEALECLILAMKSSSSSAKSPMVSKCVNEMITRLEEVKAANIIKN
jgi:tetratricopeptide (TPR) repeat protein